MSGPPATCPICRAPANAPCVDAAGKALRGVHTERVTASVREMFGAFGPPVPAINGKPGGRA